MLGTDQQYLVARNAYRIAWVSTEKTDNVATLHARLCAHTAEFFDLHNRDKPSGQASF
jgi:hypothetical protein